MSKIPIQNPEVVILAGGTSLEREVSIASGKAVCEVLKTKFACRLNIVDEDRIPEDLDPHRCVLFPLIHGCYGEDGRFQAEAEYKDFLYAGCGFESSVLAFDKLASRAIAQMLNIPCALGGDAGNLPENFDWLRKNYPGGIVLKPRRQGSSVGMIILDDNSNQEDVQDLLFSEPYIVETFVPGKDITVGILGDKVLGTVGINPESGIYDYDHKYSPGMTRYEVPAEMDGEIRSKVEQLSLNLYHTLGCRDFARLDFRLTEKGEFYFLEINTLPGMTETSLLPKCASLAGLDFKELLEGMLSRVINTFRRRRM